MSYKANQNGSASAEESSSVLCPQTECPLARLISNSEQLAQANGLAPYLRACSLMRLRRPAEESCIASPRGASRDWVLWAPWNPHFCLPLFRPDPRSTKPPAPSSELPAFFHWTC